MAFKVSVNTDKPNLKTLRRGSEENTVLSVLKRYGEAIFYPYEKMPIRYRPGHAEFARE